MRLSKASLSEQTIINPNTRTRKKQEADSIITVLKNSCRINILHHYISGLSNYNSKAPSV